MGLCKLRHFVRHSRIETLYCSGRRFVISYSLRLMSTPRKALEIRNKIWRKKLLIWQYFVYISILTHGTLAIEKSLGCQTTWPRIMVLFWVRAAIFRFCTKTLYHCYLSHRSKTIFEINNINKGSRKKSYFFPASLNNNYLVIYVVKWHEEIKI